MAKVQSEALTEVVYEPRSATLFLRFADGGWYAYLDVPPRIHAVLMAAPSKGRFFQDVVRDGFAFVQLETPPAGRS